MRFFPLRSRTTATVSAIAFAAFVALVGLSPTAVGQPNYDNFWHVDDSAPPGGDGSSWPLAYRQLELAIAAADQAGGSNLIRVGQGTYSPSTTSADPRNATYVIDFNNVTIEGGYAGFGAPDPFERDVFTYVTTISGLIDYSPDAACGPGAGSCYSAHGTPGCDDVPCCEYICDDVDPFCCDVQWDDNCATTAVNLCPGNTYHVITFSNVDRTARIDGFVITSGSARGAQTQFGGAMLIGSVNSPASPTVVQCRFTDHAALRGGAAGVQISGSLPIFANCTFTGNTASQRGGAAYVNTGSAQFVNCLFWQNTAQSGQGGGINVEPNLRVELANCSFNRNTAVTGGATGGPVEMVNSVVWGNTPTSGQVAGAISVDYSDVQGGHAGNFNLNVNPLYLDDVNGDLRLSLSSQANDVGSNELVPPDTANVDNDDTTLEATPLDVARRARFAPATINAPDICGGIVDMGAHENADCNGNGVRDEDPSETDVNDDGVPDDCQDCNANGVLDPDDIANGTSADCNETGVPDECEIPAGCRTDKNDNGVPDTCECSLEAVDIVFVVDTSGSQMELDTICQMATNVVSAVSSTPHCLDVEAAYLPSPGQSRATPSSLMAS